MPAETMTVDQLIRNASNATSVLKRVTSGKAGEEHAETTVHTLQQLTDIIDRVASELAVRHRTGGRLETALERIAELKVRSAGELIEQGKWKKIAEELQAIAQSALHPEATTPVR